jgi:hypothetical protein
MTQSKNIHILQTDKPSRLYLTTHEYIFEEGYSLPTDECENKNIYITSDEDIKEGDWFLNTLNNQVNKCDDLIYEKNVNLSSWCKKIILTTDQDLIKDGVQAIDDEFLEWFVKNPSCEKVEVQWIKTPDGIFYHKDNVPYGCYKIIIPQEEPKPHSFCETPESKCTMNYCDENGCQNRKRELVEPQEEHKQDYSGVHLRHCYQGEYEDGCKYGEDDCPAKPLEPKQETLEEVAEIILANNIDGLKDALKDDDLFYFYKGVIQCYGEAMANWQQERMYSDIELFTEELKDKIDSFEYSVNQNSYISDYIKEWFEQFKK